MKIIEVTEDQQKSLMQMAENACEALMELKGELESVCGGEGRMGEREGDAWYIKQMERRSGGRYPMGERMGNRMGRRGGDRYERGGYEGMRDPYYE